MKYNSKGKEFLAIVIWSLSVLFFLPYCSPPPTVVAPSSSLATEEYTSTATSTATITSTPCPPVIFNPPPTPGNKPKLIYVLLDKSGSYQDYTRVAIQVLINGLTQSIDNGDKIYIAWIGAEEDPTDYLYYGAVPSTPSPEFRSEVQVLPPPPEKTYTPQPTFTPVSNKTPSILQVAETQTAIVLETQSGRMTAEADAITATAESKFYEQQRYDNGCLRFNLYNENQRTLEGWVNGQKEIKENYIKEFLTPLLSINTDIGDGATHLYNALFIASRVIRTEMTSGEFSSYHLIIFSDMEDYGSTDGPDLLVNLEKVNVMVAMMYCDESIYCQEREVFWNDYFIEKKAISPPLFKIVQETTPDVISNFIKK